LESSRKEGIHQSDESKDSFKKQYAESIKRVLSERKREPTSATQKLKEYVEVINSPQHDAVLLLDEIEKEWGEDYLVDFTAVRDKLRSVILAAKLENAVVKPKTMVSLAIYLADPIIHAEDAGMITGRGLGTAFTSKRTIRGAMERCRLRDKASATQRDNDLFSNLHIEDVKTVIDQCRHINKVNFLNKYIRTCVELKKDYYGLRPNLFTEKGFKKEHAMCLELCGIERLNVE
jgi:hypothetical protein